MINKLELNALATELRVQLGEDERTPLDIYALVNQIENLTMVLYPLGEHISGMCIKDTKEKLIAINSTMSYGRQRFSIAHELYHLFYDNSEGFSICAKKLAFGSEIEKVADQFASYFLAPYSTLRGLVHKIKEKRSMITYGDVIALEQYFGMSHQAMLWRLVDDGYMTNREADTMRTGVMAVAKTLGYEEKLYLPTVSELQKRTYGSYIQKAEMLRNRNLISNGKYEELLLDAFRHDIVYGEDSNGGELLD